MQQNSKEIQKRYEGFLQTPFLWTTTTLHGLKPFLCAPKFTKINLEIDENQRLGKYIERFVSFEFQKKQKNNHFFIYFNNFFQGGGKNTPR